MPLKLQTIVGLLLIGKGTPPVLTSVSDGIVRVLSFAICVDEPGGGFGGVELYTSVCSCCDSVMILFVVLSCELDMFVNLTSVDLVL